MSLFTYLLRIFFFFLEREDVFLKMCYSFQENKTKKPTSEPVSCLLEEATSKGRGGRASWDAEAPVCCRRTLPASALSRLLVTENWEVSRAPVSDPGGDSEVTELPVL